MEWGRLFNDDWSFVKKPYSHKDDRCVIPNPEEFFPVQIPHDWLIYDTRGLYEDGVGWYRKLFFAENTGEKLFFLRFDGVYMDCTIYINRRKCGEWKYGYSAFVFEITEYLKEGENEIIVQVIHLSPNSRWYSGAGIYRNVWLQETEKIWLVQDGTYIVPRQKKDGWSVSVTAELGRRTEGEISVRYRLFESSLNGKREEIFERIGYSQSQISSYGGELELGQRYLCEAFQSGASAELHVDHPVLWSPDSPFLYILEQTLFVNGRECETRYYRFGFRTLCYRPESGFWLNGKHTKLRGVCEHHDLGCLGAAYNQTAMRRKFRILKNMGVNAVRCAHNMPAAEMMDLADEMGILILSECFDMWEKPKTTYDYARFFKEWYQKDVASWIRRDRNHPSVIMWSIGNEIYDTHAGIRGQEITKLLCSQVRKHDPEQNAPVTIGSNYMPWENAQKCADIVKLTGYNYSEKYYDIHHKEHPDWIIYGSETASIVQSRGIYHFPYAKQVLADEDGQCSALGNSRTSWGAESVESCIVTERDCEYSCGQFLWSGFDYIGEPTPYHTKNSYFGQIDTAGFPKDSYYIYRAAWKEGTEGSALHLFPYWDFNEGETIDVRAVSNAPLLELFVNGKSRGVREIDMKHGKVLTGNWSVPYEPGEIRVAAYDTEGRKIDEQVRRSFGNPARIVCTPDRRTFLADGRDLIFVEISMEDAEGNPVENANNRACISAQGSGFLAGTDNGDSTDYESWKSGSRRLFSGKLLAVIQADTCPGEVTLRVTSEGLPENRLVLRAVASPPDIPVRKIALLRKGDRILTKEKPSAELTARLIPENASYKELVWSVVDEGGIPTHLAQLWHEKDRALVTARGDGSFRVRCMSKNGDGHIRLISQMDFEATGLGPAFSDPYGFINGGSYQYAKGTPGNGNEHGVATARDGETQVGYRNLDFGAAGSDEITIPIFALSDEEYRIRIWEGMPEEEGSELIGDVIYQKPSLWNVYQEETYRLRKKLRGITDICFVLEKKVHIKGFSFTRQNSGFEKTQAASCTRIYGDGFRKEKDAIYEIGNNVTLEFPELDFGAEGADGIILCGHSPIPLNTIHVRFEDCVTGEESRQIVEFAESQGMCERRSALQNIRGKQKVCFIFLPGSRFDFSWFMFEKSQAQAEGLFMEDAGQTEGQMF